MDCNAKHQVRHVPFGGKPKMMTKVLPCNNQNVAKAVKRAQEFWPQLSTATELTTPTQQIDESNIDESHHYFICFPPQELFAVC
jgi:hypothetical protein